MLARIAFAWARLVVKARAIEKPDAVIVGYLGHLDVHLARLLWPGVPVALDHLISLADTARDCGVADAPDSMAPSEGRFRGAASGKHSHR